MTAAFGFSGDPSKKLFSAMKEKLVHRGKECQFVESAFGTVGVCFHEYEKEENVHGWLAEKDNHIVAFSGDVFLKNGQKCSPAQFLNTFLKDKASSISKVLGEFIISVITPQGIQVYRDGAGCRTAYYSTLKNRFVFSSEPKGIIYLSDFNRKLRYGAIAQYLSFSFIPTDNTFLENLYEIPAGHQVILNGNSAPVLKRFFLFEQNEYRGHNQNKNWREQFKMTFKDAVTRRIPKNVNEMGLFLSGGIDSSVVAAELVKRFSGTVKTYSIHFGKNYPNELDFAKSVADFCKTEHHEIEISPKDFIPNLRKMIWHLDDPIGDPITMPNYELSAIVSKDVNYIFNGEGGDPLFGGPKNIPLLLQHWYGGINRDPLFREKAYLQSYKRAYEELSVLLTPEVREKYCETEVLEDVLTPFFNCTKPSYFLNKLMAMNIRLKGAHLILPKVERMTGIWGLTPLAPLFDESLIKLSFNMPPKWKLQNGIEKFVLKDAFRGQLPDAVIDRPKSGMRVPVHFWFKKEMRKYCRSILSKKNIKQAGIFNYDRVKQLIDYNIEEGAGRYGLRLWMLITFEIWRRIVIENEPV